MKNLVSKFRVVFLGIACAVSMTAIACAAEKVSLSSADCNKCHYSQPADIAANGGAHKTSVSCQDCHAGHRPAIKKNIPLCSQCHVDKSHYKLKDCLRCHTNPHTPKIIKLANNITDECLTCHTQQMAKLKQAPSKHTKLACTFCHNVHGKKPLCTQCHKTHGADIAATDCKKCHDAHMPTAVYMTPDTPNKMCAACHKKPSELLAKSEAKHKAVLCVTCHKDKHKMVPACTSCHGVPHPASMMARFTKCGECHNVAHNLNHWEPKAAAGKAAPASPVKKPVKKKP